MNYTYLNEYTIEELKRNINDLGNLLDIVNELISEHVEDAYNTGYENGYDQAMEDVEE